MQSWTTEKRTLTKEEGKDKFMLNWHGFQVQWHWHFKYSQDTHTFSSITNTASDTFWYFKSSLYINSFIHAQCHCSCRLLWSTLRKLMYLRADNVDCLLSLGLLGGVDGNSKSLSATEKNNYQKYIIVKCCQCDRMDCFGLHWQKSRITHLKEMLLLHWVCIDLPYQVKMQYLQKWIQNIIASRMYSWSASH